MSLFDRFQDEPFRPLAAHAAKAKECVSLLRPMMECVETQDHEQLTALTLQVFKTEHEADVIKAEIRHRIPRNFSLPIYRGDLLAYLSLQDSIADSVEDVAVALTLKRLTLPTAMSDSLKVLLDQVLRVCELFFRAADQLPDLADHDFGGPRVAEILDLVAEVEDGESEADKAQYKLAQKLFSLDDELRATDIILWSQVIQELGSLANYADQTAERLRRMLVR